MKISVTKDGDNYSATIKGKYLYIRGTGRTKDSAIRSLLEEVFLHAEHGRRYMNLERERLKLLETE